jgi:very-short-patch-repair endonuclease
MLATTEELLDTSRRELLDLSTRNRLLSIPVDSSSARIVAVRDEISEQVYRLLVAEKRAFSFLPREAAVSAVAETGESAGADAEEDLLIDPVLSQPENERLEEDIDEATGLPKRHVDCRLQTSLSTESLQRRLLDLYHDSRAMIEEAGVNILYLALGHLQWLEADAADTPRFAPLILIPVELSRKTASEKFILRWTEEDIVENLSLYAKLKEDFGIELPDFKDDDDFDVAAYLEAVSAAIAGAKNWEVLPDEITLGFFSFAKFLMFRDLDPKAWPTPGHLINQPLIAGLLLDGFPQTENIFSDDSQLDEMIPVAKLDHGYGKNASGYMAMRFGPLGNEGGERRLNVLISRAKKRCHVFTSITADDIDLERAKGRGVASLKVFLAYAESGKLSVATVSGRAEDSPFEESVRRAVEGLGYEVVPQVGEAGFFIDLGVRDRQTPGRFILGIECDGATYHSSRSARDRDRLRQAVLEDHGWVIHRVWSTDWLQRQADQLRKIAAAIEAAKIGKTNHAAKIETNGEIIRDEALPKLDDNSLAKLAVPYIEARFEVPTRQEPHTLSFGILGDIILKIVQIEGPIHEDEITNRVKALWGFARAGSRIQSAVKRGISWLMRSDQCLNEDGFLSIKGYPIQIRNRENVSLPDLRKPERIAPSELRAAILAVIEHGHGATQKKSRRQLPEFLDSKTRAPNSALQWKDRFTNSLNRTSSPKTAGCSNAFVEVEGDLRFGVHGGYLMISLA